MSIKKGSYQLDKSQMTSSWMVDAKTPKVQRDLQGNWWNQITYGQHLSLLPNYLKDIHLLLQQSKCPLHTFKWEKEKQKHLIYHKYETENWSRNKLVPRLLRLVGIIQSLVTMVPSFHFPSKTRIILYTPLLNYFVFTFHKSIIP